MKKKYPFILSILLLLMVGVASWSIYNLLNRGFEDSLKKLGVNNFYIQNSIIILIVLIILIILGYKTKKAIKTLLKG